MTSRPSPMTRPRVDHDLRRPVGECWSITPRLIHWSPSWIACPHSDHSLNDAWSYTCTAFCFFYVQDSLLLYVCIVPLSMDQSGAMTCPVFQGYIQLSTVEFSIMEVIYRGMQNNGKRRRMACDLWCLQTFICIQWPARNWPIYGRQL